jgi:hypothetical protein
MSIDPRGMSLLDWADSVVLSSSDTWDFGRLDDPESWQDWAVGLVRASPFTQRVLPDPYQFTDWRDWAMRAYPMLEGAG